MLALSHMFLEHVAPVICIQGICRTLYFQAHIRREVTSLRPSLKTLQQRYREQMDISISCPLSSKSLRYLAKNTPQKSNPLMFEVCSCHICEEWFCFFSSAPKPHHAFTQVPELFSSMVIAGFRQQLFFFTISKAFPRHTLNFRRAC